MQYTHHLANATVPHSLHRLKSSFSIQFRMNGLSWVPMSLTRNNTSRMMVGFSWAPDLQYSAKPVYARHTSVRHFGRLSLSAGERLFWRQRERSDERGVERNCPTVRMSWKGQKWMPVNTPAALCALFVHAKRNNAKLTLVSFM